MTAMFIAAGQSEMVGFGLTAADVPPHLQGPLVGAMIWTPSGWQALHAGVNTGTAANPQAWGPIVEFAWRWIQDHPGDTAYFVLSAKGSTGLATDPGALDWSPSSSGEMFATTTSTVAAAKAALAGMGVSTHVDGLLWDQGQTDAASASASAAYQANLTGFLSAARDAWADPTANIAFGRVSSASAFPYGAQVQAAQSSVDGADGNAASVSSDAFGLQTDNIHYNAAGQVSFGDALYDAWNLSPRAITGTAAADTITGGSGADSITGGEGRDWFFGGAGGDWLQGNAGSDTVNGGAGADTLIGGKDDDVIRGGKDNDVLEGANGADWLSGDVGADTISGGAGGDLFHSSAGAGVDRVTDFNLAEGDRVHLDPGDAYSIDLVGGDTVIHHGAGGEDLIVLVGVQLTSGDPIFGGGL